MRLGLPIPNSGTRRSGLPNRGPGMRRKYFTESNNSLHELVAAVDLACTLGALSTEKAQAIQKLSVRTKNMLGALLGVPRG